MVEECENCSGTGRVSGDVLVGPGIFIHVENVSCPVCSGGGSSNIENIALENLRKLFGNVSSIDIKSPKRIEDVIHNLERMRKSKIISPDTIELIERTTALLKKLIDQKISKT